MVDFISEVQEELRKDDYNRWLKRYGPVLLGLLVAGVLVTAFLEWRKSQNEAESTRMSQAYISASEKADEGDVDGAVNDFLGVADIAPSGYAGLSLMRAAELKMGQGDTQEALRLLDRAASEFNQPRHAQLAQIKAAYILAGQGRYDDVRLRVEPLAVKDEPYEYLARELLGFAAQQTDDLQTAREQFSYLETIPGVPQTIQSRASQYLSLISAAESSEAPADATITLPEDLPADEVLETPTTTDIESVPPETEE